MDWSSFTLGNAAGFIKGPGPEFDDMLRSAAGEICVGSITVEERAGNPGTVYHYDPDDGSSINSLGLPNMGMKKFLKILPDLRQRAKDAGKRLRISLAGFEPAEYGKLASAFAGINTTLEINLGCPNVWGTTGQKPIAAFDPALSMNILSRVTASASGSGARIAVKLSPYSNPESLAAMIGTIRGHCANRVHEVVSSNTFPNGKAFVGQKPAIAVPYGGIGGSAMRLIALGQVAQLASALRSTDMRVIGVGGVSRGRDLVAMHAAGASGVQVGTAFGEQKAKIFSEILAEAAELVE
jgi:dihydroorotate dehydrogenase (fumarate)